MVSLAFPCNKESLITPVSSCPVCIPSIQKCTQNLYLSDYTLHRLHTPKLSSHVYWLFSSEINYIVVEKVTVNTTLMDGLEWFTEKWQCIINTHTHTCCYAKQYLVCPQANGLITSSLTIPKSHVCISITLNFIACCLTEFSTSTFPKSEN